MKEFDPEQFETRYKITEAAVELFKEHGDAYTIKQVARETGLDVAEVFDYFPNKEAILQFYYTSLVIRYRLMLEEIDDFSEYLLDEKLSNFIFTSFDIMQEQPVFVEMTFKRLILCSSNQTDFEKEVLSLFREFFTEDSRISSSSSMLMNSVFYSILLKKYLYMVRFWLNDESEDKELSMELTDKLTSFLQEIMYSATIDRGLDLMKFMFSNNLITLSFDSIKKLFPEIEIRD